MSRQAGAGVRSPDARERFDTPVAGALNPPTHDGGPAGLSAEAASELKDVGRADVGHVCGEERDERRGGTVTGPQHHLKHVSHRRQRAGVRQGVGDQALVSAAGRRWTQECGRSDTEPAGDGAQRLHTLGDMGEDGLAVEPEAQLGAFESPAASAGEHTQQQGRGKVV